jgi:hypothetical protein
MALTRIAALIVIGSLALALSAALAGAAPAGCVPSGSKPLRASGPARIYSRGAMLYGCVGSRRTLLGSLQGTTPFPARRVTRYALSSGYAATDTVDMGVDTLASSVTLVDLRTGATIATAPATTPESRPESFLTVTAIAVNANGAAAWIGERSAIGQRKPVYEVHALVGADNRLLASATAKLAALRLQGNKLSWQAAGQTHSATL